MPSSQVSFGSTAITAIVRQDLLRQDFFAVNPWTNAQWRPRFAQNTPRTTPRSVPLMVAQSTSDEVVLPATTAMLVRDWCRAGVPISTLWLAEVTHEATGKTVGPAVTQWLGRQFSGQGAEDDCGQPTPVPPLSAAG